MYGDSDSSTDDELPSAPNRFQPGGRPAGNGRSAMPGSAPLARMHADMEVQIHAIEQEAYTSVLRAFKAQSDAITWEKESLITELRKELRVSNEEHRELLSRVNADDTIRRMREWRKMSGSQPGAQNTSQLGHDHVPSPSVSGSRKKQKLSQSVGSLSMGGPPALHPPIQASTSAVRRGPHPASKSKKPQPSMQYPSTSLGSGRGQVATRGPSAAFPANGLAVIGRKVWTRWPEDNSFYAALITNYKPEDACLTLYHAIPPEDIRWESEPIYCNGGRAGPRPNKKSMPRVGGPPGRGRGPTTKGPKKDHLLPLQNGTRKKVVGDIEILHTDTLIKEVEKVFGSNFPDPMEIEKAKKVLKDHEQALVEAIARLEDASDGESGNI
ncbi:unnamed protein product [Linum tenue]|uniref:ENT domain-containing protein n=1 Tax=Linum tenue TaxID=586396 RepID=A0AAV0RHE4_9ROSI|nr:unnamed protein product [Linum tenue]